MIDPGLLIVLSGPSGVGKDALLGEFLEDNPDCALSVSATTRPPRATEVNGREYHFVSREEFKGMIEAGQMLEWAEYSGNFYGTPRHTVEQELARGKSVILKIEVQGALQIKKDFPDALFVFLAPPSMEVLVQRLTNRKTEDEEMLKKRLQTATFELAQLGSYDYVIVNENLCEAAADLTAVVRAAKCTLSYKKPIIDQLLKEVITHA
ncbi:guanylate kinase [Oscillospiraceae bacterium MB08-C2-2]|nr:guanylate kinase [Oscillospiraceae bacterium MB08-C2-2]